MRSVVPPSRISKLALAVSAAPFLLVNPFNVHAQVLEEVSVTAQKRVESAQDVPISINAIASEDLAVTGAGNLEGLSESIPNIDIADSPGVTRVVIRGLGSGSGNAGFEQSVGMFIDGIYASRAALFQVPFLDLSRIEVLKGPQGVLFGKNSIAGGLSLISNRPTDSFEAEVSAAYDFEYRSHELTGIVSGPVADNLYGRLAVLSSTDESYMDNPLLDKGVPTSDVSAVRGTLLWDASESTEVLLKVESSKIEELGSNWQVEADYTPGSLPYILENNPGFTPSTPVQQITAAVYHQARLAGEDFTFDDASYINDIQHMDQDADNVTFQLTHDLNGYELVYLFGYGAYDRHQISDQDFTALPVVRLATSEDFEQQSHEFRISSPGGQTVDYIAGLYYLDREFREEKTQDTLGLVPTLASSIISSYPETSTSYAAFGQATWNISDSLRASLGLRYSSEEKEAANTKLIAQYQTEQSLLAVDPQKYGLLNALFNRSDFTYDDQLDETSLDPAFNLQWNYSALGMAYISWTKASKAGGFNASETGGDIDNFQFDPEYARSLEVGLKTEFLDGRARLNAALFRTAFDDLQVGAFDPTVNGFVVTNAAKALSQGLEMEGLFAATDELTLGGSFAYLNAEYQDFTAGCPNNGLEAAKLDCYQDPNGPAGRLVQDLDGERLDNAPELTASLFADYATIVLEDLMLGTRFDTSYKDETSLDFSQDSNLMAEDYWKLNLRLSLGPVDDKWKLALSMFNLTDEQPTTFAGQAFLLPGVYWKNLGRGREVQLSATYRFGQ